METDYRYGRKRRFRKKRKTIYADILIPVRDDFGDIIRHKKETIKKDIESYEGYLSPWDDEFTGPGLHHKYGYYENFIKCKCGRYSNNLILCKNCGGWYAKNNLLTYQDLQGDRARHNSYESLFMMGRIGCDVAMELHNASSFSTIDGRDVEHSHWWGG